MQPLKIKCDIEPQSPASLAFDDETNMKQQIMQLMQMVVALQIQAGSETDMNAQLANQHTKLQLVAAETIKSFQDHIKDLQKQLTTAQKEQKCLQAKVTQLEAQLSIKTKTIEEVKSSANALATRHEKRIKELQADVKRMHGNELLYEAKIREEENTWTNALANVEKAPLSPYSKRCTKEQYTAQLNRISDLRGQIKK
jgi:chromosome segregation ATPase